MSPEQHLEHPPSPLHHQIGEEERHRFHHARNKTGHKDPRPYSEDPLINERWAQLSNLKLDSKTPFVMYIAVPAVQSSFVRHAITTLSRTMFNMDNFAGYQAIAHTARDQLITQWNLIQQHHTKLDVKRVYYMSMEFLMGRSLQNAVLNMGLNDTYTRIINKLMV